MGITKQRLEAVFFAFLVNALAVVALMILNPHTTKQKRKGWLASLFATKPSILKLEQTSTTATLPDLPGRPDQRP